MISQDTKSCVAQRLRSLTQVQRVSTSISGLGPKFCFYQCSFQYIDYEADAVDNKDLSVSLINSSKNVGPRLMNLMIS